MLFSEYPTIVLGGPSARNRHGDSTHVNSGSTSPADSSDSSSTQSESTAIVEKRQEIELLLGHADVDLWKLRELCLSEGGLLNGT
jgi:hypothetical protein